MRLAYVTLVVPEYDEAIAYFTSVFGFCVREDRYLHAEGKRWVVIAPTVESPLGIVLGRATNAQQRARIGNQTGGRVFLFLHTDDIAAELASLTNKGVTVLRPVESHDYGSVAVVEDRYGNYWDVIQPV
jgi:predicted enzyme related to lactoylglutathione lyase